MDGAGRFCFVRGISVWPAPVSPDWDGPLLDFLIWTSKVIGRKSSTLKGRCAAIRFAHLVNGHLDCTLHAHSANALIKGLKKREFPQRKRPFNTDFICWARKELACKSASRSTGAESTRYELCTACILGFSYLFRISGIEASK